MPHFWWIKFNKMQHALYMRITESSNYLNSFFECLNGYRNTSKNIYITRIYFLIRIHHRTFASIFNTKRFALLQLQISPSSADFHSCNSDPRVKRFYLVQKMSAIASIIHRTTLTRSPNKPSKMISKLKKRFVEEIELAVNKTENEDISRLKEIVTNGNLVTEKTRSTFSSNRCLI